MPMSAAIPAFLAGALASLGASWVLVSRLERVAERARLPDGLLGMVAALAADAPEIVAAVSASAGHQQQIGLGVVFGSNVFNLAALLGLSAVLAGRIALDRKVVLLGGAMAVCVAAVSVAVVMRLLPAPAGLGIALTVIGVEATLFAVGSGGLGSAPLPPRLARWFQAAVAEEEREVHAAVTTPAGRWRDAAAATAALAVVLVASTVMERAAAAVGTRLAVPALIVGGLVLAAVTSLPNAVAATHLALRRRGPAAFSTAMNSNTLNVVVGLLMPAAIIGLGPPAQQAVLVTLWYALLTIGTLALAWHDRGLRRRTGALIIAAYGVFGVWLLAAGRAAWPRPVVAAAPGAVTVLLLVTGLLTRRRGTDADRSREPRPAQHRPWLAGESLVPGWPVRRVWLAGLTASLAVAGLDAILGHRLVLIGLLAIGPCTALLTGRWVPTAITGLLVVGLAVVLGIPDAIWGTVTQVAFVAAVTTVALAATLSAARIATRHRGRSHCQ